MTHPLLLVAGRRPLLHPPDGGMGQRAAMKTGAEAVFGRHRPEHGIGVAVKIADGSTAPPGR